MSSENMNAAAPVGSHSKRSNIPPRERILAAARKLFYMKGIRAVSVDAIAEAASTNKMTLYRHFESKDMLVAEYLNGIATEYEAHWNAVAKPYPADPEGQLKGWIDHIASGHGGDDRPFAKAEQRHGRREGEYLERIFH